MIGFVLTDLPRIIAKFIGPILTAILGLISVLDPKGRAVKVISACLIIIAGVVSAVAIETSAKAERLRTQEADERWRQSKEYAEELLERVTYANNDLAMLEVKLDRLESQGASTPSPAPARQLLSSAKTELASARQRLTNLPSPPTYVGDRVIIRDSVKVDTGR